MRYSNSIANLTRSFPTVGTDSSGKYRTLTLGTTSTGVYKHQGAYVAGETSSQGAVYGMYTDLDGYSKIVLEYDFTTTGTADNNHLIFVTLFASKNWVWSSNYQDTATNIKASSYYATIGTFTNQKLELTISNTGGYKQVGIGINEAANAGTKGELTIKKLYAEK